MNQTGVLFFGHPVDDMKILFIYDHVTIQGVPKNPKSIEINALFEFECPLNLNAKMRKILKRVHILNNY
jgi:hypothetical protein